MKSTLFLGGFIFLIFMNSNLSSAQTSSVASAPANSDVQKLRSFLADDWKYWMIEYPEMATSVGFPGQNDRWTDHSPAANERRIHHLDESLKTLRTIPRENLPPEEQLNFDLYQKLIENAIAGLRFHDDADPFASVVPGNLYIPITQMDGLPRGIPATIAMMEAARPKDYEDTLARLNSIPAVVDQTIELMKEGVAHGWVPPRITLRDVPRQIESQIVADATKSPLLDAFAKYPATIPSAQQADFTRRAVAAYTEKIAPAFRKLHDFVVSTYLPACREAIAVRDLPDGADFYTYLVRWHTTTDLTPEQIHQIGLEQVKQIRAQMDQVIAQSGFKGSFEEFVKFLNTDPQFDYASADDLLLHYRDISKRADPQLAHLFGKLPRLPYGVKPIPDAVAPSQTSGYYEAGAPAIGRPGYFYVNTYKLESRPRWDAEDLTMHEAVPGHHLQLSLAQEMEGVPEFRRWLGYSAYVEGWALYSESLGSEMGFYTDPYSKFGYLSAQMWRAVRLVVDTGIHSMGWSREKAIQYFKENSGQPEQNVVVEVDRYIVWPGQALGYKIGQLRIQELRHAAEKELGQRFDIRAFHDTVLGEGALPLDVLEARTRAWVAAQSAKQSAH
jgi:uncharacterized protein (DUF885 family)